MSGQIVALTGGVGGAKLVAGLYDMVDPAELCVVVNTGDDFEHLGLWVSPDIDTLLYTLSGQADSARGWGRAGETWSFMEALRRLGGEDWFQLGDGDLALHVWRTANRREGLSLSAITAVHSSGFGIGTRILPMSDEIVSTHLDTDEGLLPFQRYFVARQCAPVVRTVRFFGAEQARPAPGVVEAIRDPATAAILVAPSNPYLSIDPILAVPGIREALRDAVAPVVAISPIIAGQAVKGPTAKLMRELGVVASPLAVCSHYEDFLDAIVIDEQDAGLALPIPGAALDIVMRDPKDRARVARAALDLAGRL